MSAQGEETTRKEHLAWCKQRALEYLDRGDTVNGFMSMMSDMSKHPETKNHAGLGLGAGLMLLPGWINNPVEVRRWIEGFN